MHDRTKKVFDEVIQDTSEMAGHTYLMTTWSSIEHSEFLVKADQLVVQVVGDVLSGANPVPVTITVQHSGDGRTWRDRWVAVDGVFPGTPSLTPGPVPVEQTSLWGGESVRRSPTLQFARLQIAIGNGKQ